MPLPPRRQLAHPVPPWLGLVLAFYAFVAIAIAEGGLGVLLPAIMQTFQLSSATVSLLFLSQTGGYIIAAFTSSLLSQHLGLSRLLLIASILLTFALITYAITPFWSIMVLIGSCLGLGIGWLDAGINTYMVNHLQYSRLMGMLHGFYGVGAFLGPAIATTLLGMNLSWQQVYFVLASIVGLLVIGLLWKVLTQEQTVTQAVVQPVGNAKANLRAALRSPVVWGSALLLMLYVGVEVSISNWAYSVQTISRNTPEAIAGYSISAYWMGLTIGRMMMAQALKQIGAIRLMDVSFVMLTLGLLIWWIFPQWLWSLPLLGLALAAIFPTTMLLMPQRIAAHLVPAAIGFLTSVASLGASGISSGLGWFASWAGLEIIPILLLPLAGIMLLLHRWLAWFSNHPSQCVD
jgi:fucose permease